MLLTLLFCSTAFSENVRVRAYTNINNQKNIYLIDIVDSKKLAPQLKEVFSKVKISDAPGVGEKRILSNHVLSRLIRLRSREVAQSNQIQLIIPNQVIIENKGLQLSAKNLKTSLQRFWKESCQTCEFKIQRLSTPLIEKQASNPEWKINYSGDLPKGQFTYPLDLVYSDLSKKRVWLQGQVKILKKVPVATRALNFGDRIFESDYKMKQMDVTHAYDSPAYLKSLVGRKVQRTTRAGAIIWSNSLEKQLAVRRGDSVKVIIGENQWELSLTAVSQQNGQIGDTISVKSSSTKKIISGILTAPGEVTIR